MYVYSQLDSVCTPKIVRIWAYSFNTFYHVSWVFGGLGMTKNGSIHGIPKKRMIRFNDVSSIILCMTEGCCTKKWRIELNGLNNMKKTCFLSLEQKSYIWKHSHGTNQSNMINGRQMTTNWLVNKNELSWNKWLWTIRLDQGDSVV